MDKEEKDKKNEEGNKMSLSFNKNHKTSFSDFVSQHREQIHKFSDTNWKKNSDGKYVISKDDPWRREHEWDELKKEFHQEK